MYGNLLTRHPCQEGDYEFNNRRKAHELFNRRKGERIMIIKITRESWLKASAKEMSTDAAKELFKSDPQIEKLFVDYSFHLYTKLKGKTLTKSEFKETVANLHTELISELEPDLTSIAVTLALLIFAAHIWENLTDQLAQEEFNPEYENFKSSLKLQKSE